MGKGAIAALALAAPAMAEPVRIAMLGDSLTQGYGLPPEDGLVPQMERWLQERGADVRLINAGVSGDTTAGGLSRVDWTLTPELAGMVVALGGNDMLRGLDPALSRANLEQIVARAQARSVEVLLIGMTAAGNYGPEYKEEFDSLYGEVAGRHALAAPPLFFGGMGADLDRARGLFQADGIHPNAQGVARIVDHLGPSVLDLAAGLGACEAGCAAPQK